MDNLSVNDTQRTVLIGFSIDASLERMIDWLVDKFGISINASVLSYVKTSSGDELLAKTSIISEELEQARVKGQKKFEIPMSDEPGEYDVEHLKPLLIEYLSKPKITNQLIRDILIPACLQKDVLTRSELKKEFSNHDPNIDESRSGYYYSNILTNGNGKE